MMKSLKYTPEETLLDKMDMAFVLVAEGLKVLVHAFMHTHKHTARRKMDMALMLVAERVKRISA